MAAVAAAGGEVLIKNVIPKHLDCITAKLVEMGVEVEAVSYTHLGSLLIWAARELMSWMISLATW